MRLRLFLEAETGQVQPVAGLSLDEGDRWDAVISVDTAPVPSDDGWAHYRVGTRRTLTVTVERGVK